jgi:hypothetical protein
MKVKDMNKKEKKEMLEFEEWLDELLFLIMKE